MGCGCLIQDVPCIAKSVQGMGGRDGGMEEGDGMEWVRNEGWKGMKDSGIADILSTIQVSIYLSRYAPTCTSWNVLLGLRRPQNTRITARDVQKRAGQRSQGLFVNWRGLILGAVVCTNMLFLILHTHAFLCNYAWKITGEFLREHWITSGILNGKEEKKLFSSPRPSTYPPLHVACAPLVQMHDRRWTGHDWAHRNFYLHGYS